MKLAVILPVPFQGGVMRSAMNIIRMLALGSRASGDRLELSFGYPEGLEFDHADIETLRQLDVLVRPFQVVALPAEHISDYYGDFLPAQKRTGARNYIAFNDGVSNFEEADLWLIVSDHIYTPIAPHRRYGVVVYDYVQKYFPDILGDSDWMTFATRAQITCDADFVITTSDQTRKDVITYAGADPAKVHRFPVEFDPPKYIRKLDSGSSNGTEGARPYIMWSTILSQHENHLSTLRGLARFVEEFPHDIVITGFHTKSFDPGNPKPSIDHPYVRSIRTTIERSPELRERISFRGFVSDAEFGRLMAGAATVLHTSTGDNGTYSALEAAWLGVPTVCSRYPAMEQLARQFDLPMLVFEVDDSDSLFAALEDVIENSSVHRECLPNREQLSQYQYGKLAPEYWHLFKGVATSSGSPA